jgi:acid phosphatase (class A)
VLLNTLHKELVPIILYYKKYFDRVRPSALDTTLTTLIPVPNHPAYPSGHAAESHLFALVFSDIDPDQSAHYVESAQTIAHEREIAGVHYPSDSVAGVALAEQFFLAIKNTPWYIHQRDKAKAEWGTSSHSVLPKQN